MATQTTTRLVDDLDGSTAQDTISFGWEGKSYEIDLSAKNAKALEKALAPYISAARSSAVVRTNRKTTARGRKGTAVSRANLNDVRTWASQNGFAVKDRGRISAEVISAYESASV